MIVRLSTFAALMLGIAGPASGQDAQEIAAAFGPSHDITLEGLQGQVEWYQSGQLELSLFVRYTMSVKAMQGNAP